MLTEEQKKELIAASLDAKEFSFSPYSNFRVGAAVLTSCGKIIKGCNVENVSYGLAICAERTAYVKAVSEGITSFKAVVVTTDVEGTFTYPCGACRQFMSEFGDVEIVVACNNGDNECTTLGELLPRSFDRNTLESNANGKPSS